MLKNKVVLITGGSRGIGRSIVELFARNGAHIAFTFLNNSQSAEEVVMLAQSYGVKTKAYVSDAASFQECQRLVSMVLNDFDTIDILINNAGIINDNLLVRMTEAQWDKVIDGNLKSVFNMTRMVVKSVMRNRGGKIINVTSIIGIKGNAGQSNYAASKAGVIGFTKSIAMEMSGRNVLINAVAPGFIETDMTAEVSVGLREKYKQAIILKRFGSSEEVAKVCLFLASDLSSYVTGQVINVDGGMTL